MEAAMQAIAIDLEGLSSLREELAAASEELATSEELPEQIADWLRPLADELAVGQGEWADAIDPYLLIELQRIGHSAWRALEHEDETVRIEGAEVAVEALQDVLDEMGERSVVGDQRSGQDIVRWLREQTAIPNTELADLLGVSNRKLDRWIAGDSEPGGEEEMRLRVAARLVNQLRHAMTAYGAVRWLQRPLPELDQLPASDLLGNAEMTPRLFSLAARARRSDAS